MSKLSRITFYEREKIELYVKMRKSHRWIGKRLCRSHTDISREVNRNSSNFFPYRTARETENAIADSIESLLKGIWLTITRDNGTENANHLNTLINFNVQSYYCDPYCSWQKGGDENLNKLVRQYLPKKADLSKVTNDDIYDIQERLNNRPRKSLNYLTPNEVTAKFIQSGAVKP